MLNQFRSHTLLLIVALLIAATTCASTCSPVLAEERVSKSSSLQAELRAEVERLSNLQFRKCSEESYLGSCYKQLGQLELAIECYKKASTMIHGWGADQNALIDGIEGVLKERPFDPELHLRLGQTFQKLYVGDEKPIYCAQAGAEYKQARLLSPQHEYPEAAKMAANMEKLKNGFRDHREISRLEHAINEAWQPPKHDGFLLTRCHVAFDDKKVCYGPVVAVTSGSEDHDRSAIEALKKISFASYENTYGVLDFACWSEDGVKAVDFCVFGRVEFNQD